LWGFYGGCFLCCFWVRCGADTAEFFKEEFCGAFFAEAFDGGCGSKGAEGGVFGDLGDHDGLGSLGIGFWKDESGGLEAVEEQAGAARVEVVGGDALEDLREGELDAGAVGELICAGEEEGAEAGFARSGVFDRATRGVVVVAEGLVAEAGAAATVAVGEDVAAAEAGFFVLFAAVVGPHGLAPL
jgi:hypothetical protein